MHLTGLRFFTVYGPWGRPDMAPFIFTKSVIEDKTINLNNNGEMWRDFTYIDDIIDAILLIIKKDPDSQFLYRIYNVGNNNPEKVGDLLNIVEDLLSKKSIKVNKEAPTGDVLKTHADISTLITDFKFSPKIKLNEGMKNFIDWYKTYYH